MIQMCRTNLTLISSRAVILSIVLLMLCCSNAYSGETEVSTRRGEAVTQDGTVTENASDLKQPEAQLTYKDDEGRTWISITSMTLKPENGASFDEFEPHKTWKYVDIQGGPSGNTTEGVVIGPDGQPKESTSAIQVYRIVKVEDAGTFPLRAEGNLDTDGNGEGHEVANTSPYWRIRVAKQPGTKTLVLEADQDYVLPRYEAGRLIPSALHNNTLPLIRAVAYEADGTAKAGVEVTFSLASIENGQKTVHDDEWGNDTTDALIEGDVPKASAPSMANLIGYFSPAYPDSIVVEATATGYEPATIEFPFASALWEERIPHYKGFTPGMPGWVVLGIGGDLKSTASKLTKTEVVSNSLALAPDDESIASIDPTEASVASTDTNVTGSKVGTTHVTAKDGETELARLQVTVKNEKEELIQFVYVKDTAGHDGTMANQAATLAEVKDIFLRQAVVVVKEKDDPIVWTIQDDMGDKPTEAAIKAKMAGHQRQPGVTYIYVWWDYDLGDAGAIHFGGIGVAVKKDSEPRSIAHELGHAFGLGHHAGRDNLMGGWGSPSGKRIEKFQADILNP